VLVWSILLYTLAAVAAGFSTSLEMLLLWRTLSFIGVCVEFVAAVAWLAELFPNPKQREAVLGYTQAFSSLGGVLVSAANYFASQFSLTLPAIYGGHSPWRYTLISAVVPAIPLIIIRPFLPESPQWKRMKDAGTLKRPSFAELFAPQYRKTTIVTALLFACGYGAAFGAIQQAPQITPSLAHPTQQEIQKLPPPARAKALAEVQKTVSSVQGTQELGGLVRPPHAGGTRVDHRQPPGLAARVPDPRIVRGAVRVLLPRHPRSRHVQGRHVLRRILYRRAVELLGQLSSARLPGTLARNGRGLCGQRRRAHARNFGGLRDDRTWLSRCRVPVARDATGVRPPQPSRWGFIYSATS